MKKIILLLAMLLSISLLTGCMNTEQKKDDLSKGDEVIADELEKILDEVGDGPDAPLNNSDTDKTEFETTIYENADEAMDDLNKNYDEFEEKLADEIDKILDEVDDGPDAPLN